MLRDVAAPRKQPPVALAREASAVPRRAVI
jgi:hypothetical protein